MSEAPKQKKNQNSQWTRVLTVKCCAFVYNFIKIIGVIHVWHVFILHTVLKGSAVFSNSLFHPENQNRKKEKKNEKYPEILYVSTPCVPCVKFDPHRNEMLHNKIIIIHQNTFNSRTYFSQHKNFYCYRKYIYLHTTMIVNNKYVWIEEM